MPRSTVSPARPGIGTALSSVRGNRPFQLLWLSNLFFFGGVWTQTLVLGWLAFESTGSEFLVAVFTAVRLAPMLLGPVAGAFADRHDRVRLLILACGWAATAVAVVAILITVDLLPYWALLAGGLAIGLAQSPSQPARAALVLSLVDRENLSNANALNALAINMTQVIGPGLGGAMVAALGAPAALWISVGWYALSLVLLLPLRPLRSQLAGRARPAGEPVFAMVKSGFREIGRNRLAVAILLVTVAANTLLWPVYQSFMPIFAEKVFQLDAAGLGALLTCGGLGGLVGSVVIAGMGDFRFKGALFIFGTGGWAVSWGLFSLMPDATGAFAMMALIGLSSAAFGVLQTTLLLMTTDPAVHGRALGLQELAIGVMPVATVVLGTIAERAGVAFTTLGAAALLILALGRIATWVPGVVKLGRAREKVDDSP